MENLGLADDNYLFQCPACSQHISDSQIHEHIQNCEFYYQHSSRSGSYSSIRSSFDNSFRLNHSVTSSDSESHEETNSVDFSSRHKQMVPSSTCSIAMCPVCLENFHNTDHPPLLLPNCGHTVCKPCLKDIRNNSDRFCCPICRATTKFEIKALPINYALLELTEKKTPAKCIEHNLEYVAYCKDDDSVLCGACLFSHKAHACCLLEDESLEVLAQNKKEGMKKEIEDIVQLKQAWGEKMEEMEELVHKINECVEIHKSNLLDAEKKIIKAIQEGSKSCVQELVGLVSHESLKRITNVFTQKIASLDNQIAAVEKKIERFADLEMADKLESLSLRKDNLKDIPSLAPAKHILEKLMVGIDYKLAIESRKLFASS